MENNLVKVYAAYRSGCLGDNILDTYFRFFANIIYDQHWEEIDETVLVRTPLRKITSTGGIEQRFRLN